MILEALMITCVGMGGVFLFLFLLICGLHILEIAAADNRRQDLAKVAAALAFVKHQK